LGFEVKAAYGVPVNDMQQFTKWGKDFGVEKLEFHELPTGGDSIQSSLRPKVAVICSLERMATKGMSLESHVALLVPPHTSQVLDAD
jgi:hypothetical protein